MYLVHKHEAERDRDRERGETEMEEEGGEREWLVTRNNVGFWKLKAHLQ